MKNKLKSRADKAARAIREYVEAPDPDIDLAEHFAGINRTAARAALMDEIRSGNVVFRDVETFTDLAEHLGIHDQLDALRQIVRDRSLDVDRRALAVSLLDDHEPGSGMSLLTDERDRIAVMTAVWSGIMRLCMESADAVAAVTRILAAAEDDAFFKFIDAIRRDNGAPASLIYADALAEPEASHFHEAMVEALVAEPSIGSLELVEHLAKTLPFEREQKLHRAAAMRIRTSLGESITREGERGGSMSPVTRRGAMLRFWFRAPAGNRVCVDTTFEPGGRIRLPMVMPSIPDQVFAEGEEATDAAIPFEQAASLFLTLGAEPDSGLDRAALAMARTIAHIELPPAAAPASPAAARSKKAASSKRAGVRPVGARSSAPAAPAAPTPAVPAIPAPPAFTADELEKLLERDEYDAWHFIPEVDADDEFDPDHPTARAKQQFLERLAANEDVVETLRWMCDYQSRWHLARGEERESAIMARLAIDLPSNFAKSPLPKLVLEHTLAMWIPEDDAEDLEGFGDEFDSAHDEDSFTAEEESRNRIRRITLAAVSKQLRANDPPAARRALDRLKSLGYSEKDAKEMIAGALAVEMFAIVRQDAPPDPTRLERRYDALPEMLDYDA